MKKKKPKFLHKFHYKSHFRILKLTKIVYHISDKVHVAQLRKTFEKFCLQRWGPEIFYIHKVFATNPVTYDLHDKNEILKGRFYKEELQAI